MTRMRWTRAAARAALTALLGAGCALALAAPVTATLPTGNVLQNPGAEAGPGSSDGSIVAVPGWTTANGFTAVQYGGSGGFPPTTVSATIGGGTNFFSGGPNTALSTAVQNVDVSGAAPDIDGAGAQATLSGDLGGFSSQTDNMAVNATFLGATGAALGQVTIGPVTAADRSSVTSLLFRSASTTLPKGTKTIQVTMTATRVDGAYNDGYADNLSLTLTPLPPPPVLGKAVDIMPVSGQVFVKLPHGATLAGASPAARTAQSLKGQGFVPLTEARQLPVGSILDTTAGKARLTAATSKNKVQFGDFSAGIFSILQARKQRGLTNLNLIDAQSSRSVCATAGKAGAARLSSKVLGLLNASGHGRFTTRGHYSASTVRGTIWSVTDRCDGTLTHVTRGVVIVRDFRRHRNVTVRAGRSYLAKA